MVPNFSSCYLTIPPKWLIPQKGLFENIFEALQIGVEKTWLIFFIHIRTGYELSKDYAHAQKQPFADFLQNRCF